ncbi:unnamed protein product, partial [marine sediment metagenome]
MTKQTEHSERRTFLKTGLAKLGTLVGLSTLFGCNYFNLKEGHEERYG